MKFETVGIHLLNDVLICRHPEILLPGQRGVTASPLCSTHVALQLDQPQSLQLSFRKNISFAAIFIEFTQTPEIPSFCYLFYHNVKTCKIDSDHFCRESAISPLISLY